MPVRASTLFRKRLKDLRVLRHWTQEQAAEACGLDYKRYQFYELGIKQNPGLQNLEKLARGFGTELHEFFAPQLTESTIRAQSRRSKAD